MNNIRTIIESTAKAFFQRLFRSCAPASWKILNNHKAPKRSYEQKEQKLLNSHVTIKEEENENYIREIFDIEICGKIQTPGDFHEAVVRITITDITDGISRAQPVHGAHKQWQKENSLKFCYSAELGKLPSSHTVLTDWMTIAHICTEWLVLPRKGKRNLQLRTSILSGQSMEELTCTKCIFTYNNDELGYVDLHENTQYAKNLAVSIAFALSAQEDEINDREVAVIKQWAQKNIYVNLLSRKEKRKFEKSFAKTVRFFRHGNHVDVYKICEEIVKIAQPSVCYEIIDCCLRVVQAGGVATQKKLNLLKKLAKWLKVNTEKFIAMAEIILPVAIHEQEDLEIILGITPDMNKGQTHRRLRDGYRKWNARVTNSNPEIRDQADQMLKLIAETKGKHKE